MERDLMSFFKQVLLTNQITRRHIPHSIIINSQSRDNPKARTPQISYKYHILFKKCNKAYTEVLKDVLKYNPLEGEETLRDHENDGNSEGGKLT